MSIEQKPKFARVYFEQGGEYSDFHYFWLRHNCNCSGICRHPTTNERVVDASEIPLDIYPKTTGFNKDSNEIEIEWQDGHKSVYPLAFLRSNAYAINRQEVPPPPNDLTLISIDFAIYREKFPATAEQLQKGQPLSDEGMKKYRRECGDKLKQWGAIVVRNRGPDTEEIIRDFLPPGKEVIPSHFGRIEDLRTDNTTNKNTDQLGYTNAGVNLHTDQPFIANPPGMQILQCVTPATVGGENAVVDAARAAKYLKQFDPEAYHKLVTTPVKFHRKQKEFESILVSPILKVDENGEIVQVRYSYFTYAPHVVAFEDMENWYRAYNKFAQLVREQQYQYYFALNSGDFVLYDNWRMFHARTSFSGPRHMRGVYLEINDVYPYLLSN